MAYAVVFWTADRQYSVVAAEKIHGEVVEGKETMVDWDEKRKGKKATNTVPYKAKIVKTGDNEGELDLLCIQLAEKMEEDNVSGKRKRKKSGKAKESEEMDFIMSTTAPSESKVGDEGDQQQEKQQQQKKQKKSRTEKTPDNKSQPEKKSSKREEAKKKKNAEIEAGKTQAAAFFKERFSAEEAEDSGCLLSQNKENTTGPPNNSTTPPLHQHSPALQNSPLSVVTLPMQNLPLGTVQRPLQAGPPPRNTVSLPSQRESVPSHTEIPLSQTVDLPPHTVNLTSYSSKTLPMQQSPLHSASLLSSNCQPSYMSLPIHNPSSYNATLLPSQSPASNVSLTRESLPSTIIPASQSLPSPIPVQSPSLVTVTTLGETGSLIRSSLHDIDYSTSPLSSGNDDLYDEDIISSGDEKPSDKMTVPCEHCSGLVSKLRAEIIALRKRQLPAPSDMRNITFLEDILKAYKGNSDEVEQENGVLRYQGSNAAETFSNSVEKQSGHENEKNAIYVAGPGKQELVPGSGVHISSARLHSIHSQSGKDPKKLFLLLIESFFSKETLATSLAHGSRTQTSKGSLAKALNQDVVKTIKAYSGRFATLNNVEFPVSKMNRILTNKVGTAKRRKLKELQINE